ncbi:MAG: sigma-70 family RNA polymerase sigma factor, partial [Ilumatobacteraceae bacterium]
SDPNAGEERTIDMTSALAITLDVNASIAPKRVHPWHHEPIVTQSPDLVSLMSSVQRGDDAAFAALYDALAAAVYGTVKRVLRDPAMSEEVTQEVFVELWRTAQRFDSERASVATWAVTMARRRAVDRVRREQSQRDRIERAGGARAEDVAQPDDITVASLEAERVSRALAELPDDQREVIEMAFINGDSHAVIAERLDLPLGTVKSRVRGGLKKLSGRLGGEQ